jgi:acyl-CoA thioester hydrolase
MYHDETGALLATVEQLMTHVDMRAGRSAPFPAELQRRLSAIHSAHAGIPRPEGIGHRITIRRQP